MTSTAVLRGVRVSARKARLVADLVRGKPVGQAVEILTFTDKKSAPILRKVIESAVANAEYASKQQDSELDVDTLYVETVMVDEGPQLRRWRPRAQGRATRVIKQSAHITVRLATR
jgi:large subunit ribosomal protein L22